MKQSRLRESPFPKGAGGFGISSTVLTKTLQHRCLSSTDHNPFIGCVSGLCVTDRGIGLPDRGIKEIFSPQSLSQRTLRSTQAQTYESLQHWIFLIIVQVETLRGRKRDLNSSNLFVETMAPPCLLSQNLWNNNSSLVCI